MRLTVATPTEIVEDAGDILSCRAEDETGAFGIQPGHADFVTVLPMSVVAWKDAAREGFVVVRGGVLTVRGGSKIYVAARGAWREDQLAKLERTALDELQRADDEAGESRRSEHRLHLATIRQIEKLLRGHAQTGTAAPSLKTLQQTGGGVRDNDE